MGQTDYTPLILIGGVIGALYLFRKQVGETLSGVGEITGGAGTAVSGIGTGISTIAQETGQTFKSGVDVVQAALDKLATGIRSWDVNAPLPIAPANSQTSILPQMSFYVPAVNASVTAKPATLRQALENAPTTILTGLAPVTGAVIAAQAIAHKVAQKFSPAKKTTPAKVTASSAYKPPAMSLVPNSPAAILRRALI